MHVRMHVSRMPSRKRARARTGGPEQPVRLLAEDARPAVGVGGRGLAELELRLRVLAVLRLPRLG